MIIEENYQKFNKDVFDKINGVVVLKKEIDVHHIDFNHSNNNVSNLQPMTRGEHTKLHNRRKKIMRDAKGRISTVMSLSNIGFEEAEELNDTERGSGGYGHTGK